MLVYSDKFAKIEGIYKTDKEIGASVDTFFLGSDLPLDAYVRLANRQGTGAEDSEVTVSDGASHPDYSFPLISSLVPFYLPLFHTYHTPHTHLISALQ